MNIFFLDSDVKKCAEYHVDKHVVKMRLELAQLACTAHHILGTNPEIIPYKKTHQNHPSAIWARESLSNYIYILDLAFSLSQELRYRFGTENQKIWPVLEWLSGNNPKIKDIGLTCPKLAINWESLGVNPFPKSENESDLDWAVKNYRLYYNLGKKDLHKWTKRESPNWIIK